MQNKDRIGQIAVDPGNECFEPCVVHVLGVNGMGSLSIQIINTDTLTTIAPDESTLLDYDFKKYEILRAEWNIERSEKRKQGWIKILHKLINPKSL